MLMSVDLPAPFSPRSACTSPRASSKSTRSFARTPGNRLVTLLSSSRGVSAIADERGRAGARPLSPELFQRGGRVDLPADQLLTRLVDGRLDLLGNVVRERREQLGLGEILDPEERVAAALEIPVVRGPDRLEDGEL